MSNKRDTTWDAIKGLGIILMVVGQGIIYSLSDINTIRSGIYVQYCGFYKKTI